MPLPQEDPESPIFSAQPTLGCDNNRTVIDLMQGFQNSLDSKLESVCSKLDDISNRMVQLEQKQETLEELIHSNTSVEGMCVYTLLQGDGKLGFQEIENIAFEYSEPKSPN